MKYQVYCLISTFFLLNVLFNAATEPVVSQKKNEQTIFNYSIQQVLQPTAMVCTENDVIAIVNIAKYQAWSYHTNKLIQQRESMLRGTENICFHHNKNIAFYFDHNGGFIFNFNTDNGKSFYSPTYSISAGCFSKKDSILFIADKKKFISYNYKTEKEYFIELKRTMGMIFACPSQNNNFFICSDFKKKYIYQIETGKKYEEKKLFPLKKKNFIFDKTNWAYSDALSLLCLINSKDRILHIFDIKNGKSKIYQHDDDFPISNIMFHSNKTILTLLSQNREYIEYVDMRDFDKIHPVLVTKHTTLGGRGIPDLLMSESKMTFSSHGRYLFIAAGSTIFNIHVPFLIAHQPDLKKYELIRFLSLPRDIQKLLLWYLLRAQ